MIKGYNQSTQWKSMSMERGSAKFTIKKICNCNKLIIRSKKIINLDNAANENMKNIN